MCFAKFDHLNQCNTLWSITFIKYIFLQIAQKKSQRLTASEIFHQPLVSETFIKHENDPNLMKIKSPYSNTFGMYCLLPFHSMTVNFDEKHLTFWNLGNAFYGTPGIFPSSFVSILFEHIKIFTFIFVFLLLFSLSCFVFLILFFKLFQV